MTARDLAYRVGQASGDDALMHEVQALIDCMQQCQAIAEKSQGWVPPGLGAIDGPWLISRKLATALGEKQ